MKRNRFFQTIIALLCSVTINAHDFVADGIYYNITSSSKSTVEVTYRGGYWYSCDNEYTGKVVIPETITYRSKTYTVTSIGNCAFSDCDKLTSVTMPNSITSIGKSAFNSCSGLTSVTIPNSVTSIGGSAFSGCSGLTSVTIPNSVTSIGSSAFYGCINLTSVNISDIASWCRIKFIDDEYGYGYQSNPLFYANNLYLNGELVKDLVIPETITEINPYTFYNCSCLTSVTIPNNVTNIAQYAFYGCQLSSLTIGTGVLSIGSDQSKPIKTIWFTNTPPEGYEYLRGVINYVANEQYTKLSNKHLYKYLSSMFVADGVKYVPVNPSERTCDIIDCCNDFTVVNVKIDKTVSYKNVAMTIKEVKPYAFYNNKEIKTVSVNHSGNIGDYAFYGCTGIKEITISNIGNIGPDAFYGCTDIKEATISNEGNIGGSAFEGAIKSSPATVNVSNKGHIASKAFYRCTGITEATISNEGTIGESAFEGAMSSSPAVVNISNKGDIYRRAFYNCSDITDATIMNEGAIGGEAFYNCASLSNLTLCENITSIGESAFSECRISDVVIPNKVTTLEQNVFSGCRKLKSISIGANVKSIGKYTFKNCSSLPKISIPKAVTSIGDYAFSGCKNITNVIIEDKDGETELTLGSNGSKALFSDCPLDSVYIGANIKYNTSSSYGYSPFYRNTSLRTVVITDKEDEIYANEFYGCTNLKNVQIGDGVKSIGDWAFSGCSNLDYFAFGTGLQSIGKEAFSDCVNVTKLISYAVAPPKCGEMALDDINKWNCTLQIPQQSLAAYQAADQWKEFFFIEGFDATGIEGVTADNPSLNVKANVYTLDGTLIKGNANISNLSNELPKGIYIVNGKKFYVK